MRTTIILCVLSIQLVPSLPGVSASQQQQEQRTRQKRATEVKPRPVWRPGIYLGLTVGKSTRADVLRVLGEPERVDTRADQEPDEPNPEVWYVYKSGAEFFGERTVVIDKRTEVILGIDVSPEQLSKEEVVKHFGPDYILTRYNFDECLGNEESAPVYELADGPLLEVDYRHRGIAISVTEDGRVNAISYVSKPTGTPVSRCNSLNQNATKRNPVTTRRPD